MKKVENMSRAELAAYIQEHLRNKGIDVILSGGACVSIYSQDKYVSMDLDMIRTAFIPPKRAVIRGAMEELGFREHGRYFQHKDAEYFVEFPKGMPSLGEEPVEDFQERFETTGILKLLSPTDCVKDRLIYYYHNNDYQSLEQAVLVAQMNRIEIKEIKRWSEVEGKGDAFAKIRSRLEAGV